MPLLENAFKMLLTHNYTPGKNYSWSPVRVAYLRVKGIPVFLILGLYGSSWLCQFISYGPVSICR